MENGGLIMTKNIKMQRAISVAGSAALIVGLLAGFSVKNPNAFAVRSEAASYTITAGNHYTVTATSLNIRSGPGINYARQGRFPQGTLIKILETNGNWGRTYEGWVSLDYLAPENSVVYPDTAFSGVVNASALNIRSGPGLSYGVVGQYVDGYKVTISATQNGWGKTNDGWVNLDYINRNGSTGNSQNGTTPSGIYVNSNVTVTADSLNLRQGPGTNYARVGRLPRGYSATILEIKNGWGRIHDGWISLNYVRPATSGSNSSVNQYFAGNDTVKVVSDGLMIRSGPDKGYQAKGMLTNGYIVALQEVQGNWGRIQEGWICLDHVVRVK